MVLGLYALVGAISLIFTVLGDPRSPACFHASSPPPLILNGESGRVLLLLLVHAFIIWRCLFDIVGCMRRFIFGSIPSRWVMLVIGAVFMMVVINRSNYVDDCGFVASVFCR